MRDDLYFISGTWSLTSHSNRRGHAPAARLNFYVGPQEVSMLTAKQFRCFLAIYLLVSVGASAFSGGPKSVGVPAPELVKAIQATGGFHPTFFVAMAVFMLTETALWIWGCIGLFLLRSSGRTCFTASIVLSFARPLLLLAVPTETYSVILNSSMVKLPTLGEIFLGDLSSFLSGILITTIFTAAGSHLFKK